MNDNIIRAQALEFAKHNKTRLAREFVNSNLYVPDPHPVSFFMAGSPGAGKTEFSKNLINILEKHAKQKVIRIDGDELRRKMPGYTGGNSSLFQGAVSLIVEKIHDLALHNGQTFLFDSTFAKYEKAVDNIRRSLEKSRPVLILYLFQKPEVAWKFTQAREKAEGRNIPKASFIEEFIGAHDTVNRIQQTFAEKVEIFLVKKDFEKNTVENIIEIGHSGKTIDDYLNKVYTKNELENLL